MQLDNKFKAPLIAPLTVCFWITDYCQLSCKYCYAENDYRKHMDTFRLKELVDELEELGVFAVGLAGGEPTLHPDFIQIVDYLLDKNFCVQVLSNGILLENDFLTNLNQVVADRYDKFMLQISLDSAEPSLNDTLRGSGELVTKNIREAAKCSFPIQISCVVSKLNYETAHLIIDEFYPDVKLFHFMNLQRTNLSLQNPDTLIDKEMAYRFWMNLKEHAKNFPEDLYLPSLRTMLRNYSYEMNRDDLVEKGENLNWIPSLSTSSCVAGLTHINIDSDFNVLGCDIAKDYTNMGNVRHNSFASIWNSEQAYNVRNNSKPACHCIMERRDKVV